MSKHTFEIDKEIIPLPLQPWDNKKATNPLRKWAKTAKFNSSCVVKNIGVASRLVGYLKDESFYGTMRKINQDGEMRVWKLKSKATNVKS